MTFSSGLDNLLFINLASMKDCMKEIAKNYQTQLLSDKLHQENIYLRLRFCLVLALSKNNTRSKRYLHY